MIEAVIFDLDDLMIDSEIFHFEALKVLMKKYGKTTPEEWFEPLIGLDNYESAEFVIKTAQLPITVETYLKETLQNLLDLLPQFVKPNPGLLELIEALEQAGYRLGVASNSFKVYVKLALETLGVHNSFQCVVTADDVKQGKPAPDIYLRAAECLDVAPENCLALEDSPVGMISALAAGMSCVVIPNAYLKEANFSEATHVFPSLEAVHKALPAILNDRKA
jgi:HAD superfamily hydrolase (TIGR01509 family)